MTDQDKIHARHERAIATLEKLRILSGKMSDLHEGQSPETVLRAMEIDALFTIGEQLAALREAFDRMPIVAYGLKRKDDVTT